MRHLQICCVWTLLVLTLLLFFCGCPLPRLLIRRRSDGCGRSSAEGRPGQRRSGRWHQADVHWPSAGAAAVRNEADQGEPPLNHTLNLFSNWIIWTHLLLVLESRPAGGLKLVWLVPQYQLKKVNGQRLDFDYKKRRRGKVSTESVQLAWDKFMTSKELAERSMFVLLDSDVSWKPDDVYSFTISV